MSYTAEERQADKEFMLQLIALKTKAGSLKLYRTLHALDAAIQEVGWEMAMKDDPEQSKLREKYLKGREKTAVRR